MTEVKKLSELIHFIKLLSSMSYFLPHHLQYLRNTAGVFRQINLVPRFKIHIYNTDGRNITKKIGFDSQIYDTEELRNRSEILRSYDCVASKIISVIPEFQHPKKILLMCFYNRTLPNQNRDQSKFSPEQRSNIHLNYQSILGVQDLNKKTIYWFTDLFESIGDGITEFNEFFNLSKIQINYPFLQQPQ